jgi:DNA-binding transcriptional LysR family regulator
MHNAGMLDWDDLRFLLAVARDGSTAAAARTLAVNQSTVVRRVTTLEAGLGLRLFNRQRQGYRLTAEGQALIEQAARVEGAVLDFARRAAALDQALTGSLRVTTAEGMALNLVPRLLSEFHRRHPGLQVDLLIEDRYHDLGDGTADVALRAGPPGDASLVGRKLADQAWAVYASRCYLEQFGMPNGPAGLERHRVVGFEGALAGTKAARWLQAMAPRSEITCRSNSILGLLFAAQSGSGLTLLPCLIGDSAADLLRVVDPEPGLTGGFWILTHPDRQKQPKVRAFLDFMAVEIVEYRPLLLGQSRPPRQVGDPDAALDIA